MWTSIKSFFRDSETLAWARLQVALGVIAGALTFIDPSLLAGVLPAEWFPWVLLLNGLATEYLRRRRDDQLGGADRNIDWDV